MINIMKTKIIPLLLAMVACVGMMQAEIISNVPIGDLNYDLDTNTKSAEVKGRNNEEPVNVTIPPSVSHNGVSYTVTSIGDNAFEAYYAMESVSIPNTITKIGTRAFWVCEGLTSVTIPTSVISIGDYAFLDCDNITSIEWNAIKCEKILSIWPWSVSKIMSFTFGEQVEIIPKNICLGMKNLKSIDIPNSVKSIGEMAFQKCTGLTSMILPEGITSIGNQAFEQCTNLVSINIPSTVTSIGTYAFAECGKLASNIVIPEGVTSLNNGTFKECSSLTTVSLPSSLKRIIGTYVGTFNECDGLEKILVYRDTPANADSGTFDGVDKYTCTLYVPKNSICLYKNAPVWRDFYNIESIEDVLAIEDIEANMINSTKVIRDGKVLIRKGEKTYTLQGQETK